MISAQVLLKSYNPATDTTVTTMKVTFPRIILPEVLTHRVFSRNSSSSRAIPFMRMLRKLAGKNKFLPIEFQKSHKGMQGKEILTGFKEKVAYTLWKSACLFARGHAWLLHKLGVTKQLCNRLIEPFMYQTVIITSTEWENFFELRCSKFVDSIKIECKDLDYGNKVEKRITVKQNISQAEIHIQDLANKMKEAYESAEAQILNIGEWHIPFTSSRDSSLDLLEKLKIATARCARISYETFDGEFSPEADIKLYERLKTSKHMSPFEHCAKARGPFEEIVKGNLKGFKQLREIIEENEAVH